MNQPKSSLFDDVMDAASNMVDAYITALPEPDQRRLLSNITAPGVSVSLVVDIAGKGLMLCVNGGPDGPIMAPILKDRTGGARMELN